METEVVFPAGEVDGVTVAKPECWHVVANRLGSAGPNSAQRLDQDCWLVDRERVDVSLDVRAEAGFVVIVSSSGSVLAIAGITTAAAITCAKPTVSLVASVVSPAPIGDTNETTVSTHGDQECPPRAGRDPLKYRSQTEADQRAEYGRNRDPPGRQRLCRRGGRCRRHASVRHRHERWWRTAPWQLRRPGRLAARSTRWICASESSGGRLGC